MPSVEIKNKDVWSDFVTVNTELNDDNNQVLTDDTKMNILKFKFQSFSLYKRPWHVPLSRIRALILSTSS